MSTFPGVKSGWISYALANVISPRLKKALVKARSHSRRSGGRWGLWLFFTTAYGVVFWTYYVLETVGVAGLWSDGPVS
jgi:hypothetical protein